MFGLGNNSPSESFSVYSSHMSKYNLRASTKFPVSCARSVLSRVLSALVLLVFTATQVFAHGVYVGTSTATSTLDYSSATQTLLQNNIAAGLGGFVVGDYIEYQANLAVGVFGTTAGPNGYVTFYPPSGTEVAGAWIVDAAGTPVNASLPGGMSQGWGPRGQNTFFTGLNGWTLNQAACTSAGYTAANCNSGLAYIYGDTGIFYSTNADTAMYTGGGSTITYTNGYQINPTVTTGWTTLGGAAPVRVHNKWDAVQTNAFGAASILANPGFVGSDITQIVLTGRASTPFNSGSPVGGPDSGQKLDRNGVVGPWERISYGGSCYANDPNIAGTEGPANGIGSVVPQAAGGPVNSINVCTPTTAGISPSDASTLTNTTKAIRFAVGGIVSGGTVRVKIRLKITNPANIVANFEGHGSDSQQIGGTNGNDNPWRYWLGKPVNASAASNRLLVSKQIISVNGGPYNGTNIPPNSTIRYRVSYANGSMTAQTNVQLSDVLPTQSTSTNTYTVLSGPNIVPAVLPNSGTFNFQLIPTLAQGAGGAIEYNVVTNAGIGATVTNTGRINSTQVPTLQTAAVSTVVVAPAAALTLTKSASPTSVSAAGTSVAYTIAVNNTGNVNLTDVTVTDPLGIVACPTAGTNIIATLIAGTSVNCTMSYVVPQTIMDNRGGGDNDIDNTAAAATTYIGSPVTANGSTTVALVITPALTILKEAQTDGLVNVGHNIGYTFKVTNSGNVTITNVTVADVHGGSGPPPLPNNEAIFTDAGTLGDSVDAAVNTSWDTLAPGDTIIFSGSYIVTQLDIDNQ